MLKKTFGTLVVGWSLVMPAIVFAYDGPATHCAGSSPCLCPDGSRPMAGCNDDCRVLCGLDSGGSRNSGRDYEAERRAQEQAEAAQRAERERQAELERQRRAEEERRRQEEEERQAKFLRDRNEAAGTLRGSTGMRITPNVSGGSALRGSTVDTGIRELKPARETRDLGGAHAAWKQLNCAAAISGYAFAALSNSGKPDYDEFRNLASEAMKALNGEPLGVQCPAARPYPDFKKGAMTLEQAKAAEKKILDRAVVIAERMRQRGDKFAVPSAPAPAGETADEKLRRVQRELNEVNSRKITGKTQAEIDRQERDRKALADLILANNRLEKGELTSVSVDLSEDGGSRSQRRKPLAVPSPK